MAPSCNTCKPGDKGVHEGLVWGRNVSMENTPKCVKSGEAEYFWFLRSCLQAAGLVPGWAIFNAWLLKVQGVAWPRAIGEPASQIKVQCETP